MENFEDIKFEEISLKAKSKQEIYNLVVTSEKIYFLSKTVIINF